MSRPLPRIARSVPIGKRKPGRLRRPEHRRWVKTLPCICCGGFPCDPAHVRMNSAEHGNYNTMGDKSEDKFIVPLCARCHRIDQHRKYAEPEFWARLGIDPLDFALQLYRN